MKIIVTGSNGCVGSALRQICPEGEWVFTTRNDCDFSNREQTIEFFKQHNPTYVVHLASYVPGFYNINKVASFSENVRINENVLEASHSVGVERGLFGLSVNMFREDSPRFPIDESMMFEGSLGGAFAGYAYSKRMLAMQCQHYNEQYNRKYVGIIPCNIYGPNDNMVSGRLIPNLISKFKDAIKMDSDVILNGSGKPLRQFIYSLDLARIIRYLAYNYTDTKPIICCGDVEISVADLAATIGKVIGFNRKIEFDTSKPDGCLRKTVSNAYLKQIMPNVVFTDLESGLTETILERL